MAEIKLICCGYKYGKQILYTVFSFASGVANRGDFSGFSRLDG
jgi:hypothetical protein